MKLAIKYITIVAVMLSCFQAISQTTNSLTGNWKSDNGPDISVNFFQEHDGAYYGKINDPSDPNNGKVVFKKMVYNEKKQKFSGTLIPADKDISLDATISFEGANKIKVIAKKLLVTRTIYFSRRNQR